MRSQTEVVNRTGSRWHHPGAISGPLPARKDPNVRTCADLFVSVHTRELGGARKALVATARRKDCARQLAARKDVAPACDSHHHAIVRGQGSRSASWSAIDTQVGRLVHHLCPC